MHPLLVLYVGLRLLRLVAETALDVANRRYATDPGRLAVAGRALGMAEDDRAKAVAYSGDRYRLSLVESLVGAAVTLGVVASGGLGVVEAWARAAAGPGPIAAGLAFFAILALLGAFIELPFALYGTFVVEERHGFNRQTLTGFFLDRVKGGAVGVALVGPLLAALLAVMERMGPAWWLWAWALVAAFNLFAAWIYPTVLAPLFNRFTSLSDGELREAILALAARTGFRAGGLFVMDASRRTAHGNAYFTGLLGQKRIVLFDTLVDSLAVREVVAVLAHELGHFRLHHVRWALVRGVATSGLLFFALSAALPLEAPYAAFSLARTSYGALVVFGLWFSLASFALQPLENAISRRHEFAADAFALGAGGATGADLAAALRKLREKSRLLPLTHPLYSRVYHSHPPILERLRALEAAPPPAA